MSCRPYPGLRPFRRDEDRLFFGREAQTDELLARLGETRFVAVLGTSGSGKSSLVRAGLLPALEGGLLARAGARWQIAELRPGTEPIGALAAALARTEWGAAHGGARWDPGAGPGADPGADPTADPLADPAAALEADLRRGPMALDWLLGLRPPAAGSRLLLVVDQFEELFRFADSAPAADSAAGPGGAPATKTARQRDGEAFVALLLAAAGHPSVYVVLTMRSDFLGDCARHPGLPEAINAGLYLVPRLDPEQMADAIRLPARLCGGAAEPALVESLLEAARGEPDQLPLLQHALMRLWDRCPDRCLTAQALQDLGGLARALNDHAEEVYNRLTPARQSVAETLFRSLAERGPGSRDTRRPVRLGEVAELAQCPPEAVAAVVEAFRAPGRDLLMPPAPGVPGGQALDTDTLLDIGHESLIRQWQRLKDWTQAEGGAADLYRRLEGDARRRRDTGRASPWTGFELALAQPWLERPERTRRWALRYAAGASAGERTAHLDLALDLLAESAAAAELEQQRAQAAERAAVRALFDSELTHAALLARTEDYARARERLAATRPLDLKVPPERRLARDLLAGYVDLIGGESECVYRGAGAALQSVAVSPDGRWVAAGGERGTLVLWACEGGEPVQRLERHDPSAGEFGSVYGLAFHPGGDWLASAGEDKRVILWSLPTGDRQAAPIRQWEAPDAVWSLAVNPEGTLIATGGDDKAVTLWDPFTGKPVRTFEGHEAPIAEVAGLALSPDGKRLASASYDRTARLWSLEGDDPGQPLASHREDVQGVAFSPDGRLVATTSTDRLAILWDASTGSPIRACTGHRNYAMGVAFAERPGDAASAPLVAAAGLDRTVRVWDSESAVTQRLLQGHEAGVLGVVIRGNRLYSASNDGTVRRWSLDLPRQRLLDLPAEPASAAIAPDGRSVAVGFADGALRIYGLPGLEPLGDAHEAHSERLQRLAYSPDGTLLASAGFDNLARLWRVGPVGTVEPLLELTGHSDAVHAVAFSPDGSRLATTGYDGRIGVFATASGEGRFIGITQGQTLSVAFDPTGTRLVAADRDDRKVRTWSIAEDPPALIGEIEAGSDQLMWAEPDAEGRYIAAVGRGSFAAILDAATGEPIARLPGHEQTVLKARFLPGGRQVATVSADATLRIWDLDTQAELFALRLPADRAPPVPLWDFDLRCTPAAEPAVPPGPPDQTQAEPDLGSDREPGAAAREDTPPPAPIPTAGHCWVVVPLTRGKLAVYDLGQATWPAPPAP